HRSVFIGSPPVLSFGWFGLICAVEVAFESVHAIRPEPAKWTQPFHNFLERLRLQPVEPPLASAVGSTNPGSPRTGRCLDTVGCGIPSCRSISPTDCSDEASNRRIARRFASARISNADSMRLYILLWVYTCQGIYLTCGELKQG